MNNKNDKNNFNKNTTIGSNNRQPRRFNPMQNFEKESLNNIKNDSKHELDNNKKNEVEDLEKDLNIRDDVPSELIDNSNSEQELNSINAANQRKNRRSSASNNKNNALSNVIDNKLNQLRNNNKKKNDSDNQDGDNAKKVQDNKAKDAMSKMASAVGAANRMKNAIEDGENALDAAADDAKQVVKEKAKQIAKKKIRFFLLTKIILPALPIIGLLLLIFILVIIIIAAIGGFGEEKYVFPTMTLNYCDNVKVTWIEDVDFVPTKFEKTITNKEYLIYEMALHDYIEIDNEEVLKALAVIYRTNLYHDSNNMEGDTCEFEIGGPYFNASEDAYNIPIIKALEETHNKVFSTSSTYVNSLKVEDEFIYERVENVYDGEAYVIPQDNTYYIKSWIDQNVDYNHRIQGSADSDSFSPWAAKYLNEKFDFNFHTLLYHFYDTKPVKGDIYKVVKFGSVDDIYGNYCSDISLTNTELTREEFVNYVLSNVNNGAFKSNAGKIYDISVENNFNPEMVVIRAVREGFSPGGSTNNFWGIHCFNGGSKDDCYSYPSFDAGVLAYINNIKGHNYATAYQMMMSYAYIGDYWYNPGGSGKGGCYYFPYIRDYLSLDRQKVVEEACASGNTCTNGEAGCVHSTDEDQSAYAKWQVSRMGDTRTQVFNIVGSSCTEEGNPEETGDINTLGKRVAEYAVSTYDSWGYDQDRRHQDGYVDCSSMVVRAYGHFSYKIYGGSDTSDQIYKWCEDNGKVISSGNLQPGDLIFYSSNSYYNPSRYKGIGHVAMYYRDGQTFAAHGKELSDGKPRPWEDQVSVTLYKNNGSYFCRPTK